MAFKKLIIALAGFLIIYFTIVGIVFHSFLSSIIFLKTNDVQSNENFTMRVEKGDDQLLIRLYGEKDNKKCIIFFPGRHGNITRYETEIFTTLNQNGLSVYALSYPGYDGAKGKSTFKNLMFLTDEAYKTIENQTSCKMHNSVFLGRSLGAFVAVSGSIKVKPRAVVVDSLSPSLTYTIRNQISDHILLFPLNLLPLERILEFNINTADLLDQLSDIPVVIFQGEKDQLIQVSDIIPILAGKKNVRLIEVPNATHSNVYLLAGPEYFRQILLMANADGK
jgi:alpha-beta hydrolase superfamily lysophospholipase